MSHAPTDALSRRLQTIRDTMAGRSIDALVITSLPNVLYLTNFSGTSAIAVLTCDRLLFITDFRYVTSMTESRERPWSCPGLELVTVDGSYDATLAATLRALGAARIGFEAAHLSVSRYRWINDAVSADALELVPTEGIVERARACKDAYEVATLREAARRLSAVAKAVLEAIVPGQTERDVAAFVDRRIHDAGFDKPAFDTIVASGPHAALPHARPSERKLTGGDLIVLDFGGVYDSYCVDLTRTISMGRASGRARSVHGAVLAAHDRAIAEVKAGRSPFDVDAAARTSLGEAGMEAAFGHATGHGLGLEVHEEPRIVRRRPDVAVGDPLAEGMVFTIEPGAYFPGWGGVRIEDDVVVTADGAEVLTDVTTDLLEL
jgi:Xaa-Pro aminopeptidase